MAVCWLSVRTHRAFDLNSACRMSGPGTEYTCKQMTGDVLTGIFASGRPSHNGLYEIVESCATGVGTCKSAHVRDRQMARRLNCCSCRGLAGNCEREAQR